MIKPTKNPGFCLAARTVMACAVVATTTLISWMAVLEAQTIPAPLLMITSRSTNSMVITVSNGVPNVAYDVYTNSVLGGPPHSWQVLQNGFTGQTNFLVNYSSGQQGFYLLVVDTNSVPIWAAANTNNPSAGYLAVFIDSPTNGSNLTQ